MKHRPWRELFERLPPKTQVAVKENTAQVLTELDRAERKQHGEGRLDDEPVPARPAGLTR
ncbi:MAG: hypothetical protein OXN96_05335 [Bryobacterales bacterium]|nr:hypothetical protein [Bryobacterales bacterium]MDE0621028.1 hypothetical protein [Bryobacterales bacterium]